MAKVVKFWINEFIEENRDIDAEIDDIEGTIANERLWQIGSSTKEEIEMHQDNIEELKEYLDWLNERKAEREQNSMSV